jgi:acyl carrier protein
MRTAGRVRWFLQELLQDPVAAEDPLAEGRLDSLEKEQLLAFLEERFSIRFEDEELSAEHFESIESVASLVDAKRHASRPA